MTTKAKHAPGPKPSPKPFGLFAYGPPDCEPFIEAVYHDHKCGCKIVGNGSLPYPLKIKYCVKHRAIKRQVEG